MGSKVAAIIHIKYCISASACLPIKYFLSKRSHLLFVEYCRCQMMLHPGMNCTVRIEKNVKRMKWSKKSPRNCQNNVVYTCHFCSHRNIKLGTAKGHLKSLLSSRASSTSKPYAFSSSKEMKDGYGSTKKELPVRGEPS